MKKLTISIAIATTLILAGCSQSSNSNGKKKPTKAEIKAEKVTKFGDKLAKSPTDKNYLSLLKTELGTNHVDQVKTSDNGYKVVKIQNYRLKSKKEYKSFAYQVKNVMHLALKAKYVPNGIGFIQKSKKDDDTQFTLAYSKKAIQNSKPSKSDLELSTDYIFDDATSYYINPLFLGSDNYTVNPDGMVKAGPTYKNKMSLNTKIMMTFDN